MHEPKLFDEAPLSLGRIVLSLPSWQDMHHLPLPVLPLGHVVDIQRPTGMVQAQLSEMDGRQLRLTLQRGEPAALHNLAFEIQAAVPATLWLDRAGPAIPQKASVIEWQAGATVGMAFQTIMLDGLAHLLANRGAALARDAEGVHQLRVAVRRLRAALVLFGPLLEPRASARFQAELRPIGQYYALRSCLVR